MSHPPELVDRPGEGRPVAVVVARDGRLPLGADEAAAEAEGRVLVVGSGTGRAASNLRCAALAWYWESRPGFTPGWLASALGPELSRAPLVVLPASPDGRDLAPRLAAELARPLVARVHSVRWSCEDEPGGSGTVHAVATRFDDQVELPVTVQGNAVVTLVPGTRSTAQAERLRPPLDWSPAWQLPADGRADPVLIAEVEPDPATMDLADASRVLGGGAGLVAGLDDTDARATFDLLGEVATALGASLGGTRVATDAGWLGFERQIGTTGVVVDPNLYVAWGVSGASQHVAGLGTPLHVVSVNTDPSCPMTALADLGLVTDARDLLVEVARRLGVGAAGSSETTAGSSLRQTDHGAADDA